MRRPFSIGPGLFSQFELSKVHSEVLPYPYSDCIDTKSNALNAKSASLVDGLDSLGINYSQKYCAELLVQLATIEALDCYDLRLIKINNKTITKPCLDPNFLIGRSTLLYAAEDIFDYCPLACDTDTYIIDITKQDFPTLSYYQESIRKRPDYFRRVFNTSDARNVTYGMFQESLTYVNVFFHEMTVSEMSEKPKLDRVGLISNLGGIIGVFLGVSVLTLVEFIELVAFFIWIWLKKLKSKTKPTEME